MPDWSYRTVFRPLLFRLPARTARDLCLGVLGRLARLPLGPQFIDFLGHMRPPSRLAHSYRGIQFPAPVGLGAGIDPEAVALPALARFGFGFLEVGPVTAEPWTPNGTIERLADQQAIAYPDPPANPGLEALAERLRRTGALPLPIVARLACPPGTAPEQASDQCARMIERLARPVSVFALATAPLAVEGDWSAEQWRAHLQAVLPAAGKAAPARPVVVCVPPDFSEADFERLLGPAVELGAAGVTIAGGIRNGANRRLIGLPVREPAVRLVRHIRQRCGASPLVLASGGVQEPEHALELFEAGADLVSLDSGLVYGGPGLPKRINDALLFAAAPAEGPPAGAPAEMSWFWTLLLGVSMLLGGLLALVIAATRVVLPYDETFVNLTRAELASANDRLLPFLTHDRVTLAGTMIAVGVLFVSLSWFGIRRGLHWARVAVLAPSFAGFGSFFLFLGFGYFDPFHAFVTAVLFQFLLLGLHARLPEPVRPGSPQLREDWRWRWSQWGQLLFVIHGAVLITAGLVIAAIGISKVFVPEDLEFLRSSAEDLRAVSPRLLPLIAHDRASFGGMLVACGLSVLLASLWGYRQGAAWLWWALLLSGSAGYAAAIGVHLAVGYTNLGHLAPAFGGATLLLLGSVLSYPYLCRPDPAQAEGWRRHVHSAVKT